MNHIYAADGANREKSTCGKKCRNFCAFLQVTWQAEDDRSLIDLDFTR